MSSGLKPSSARRLAAIAASVIVIGCSSAPAQQSAQSEVKAKPEPGELWRCFAHQAYFKEEEAGIWPATKVVAGKMVFHAVTPDEQWVAGAELKFTSLANDPEKRHGNGISAIVRLGQPDRVEVYMTVDGRQQPLGEYPYGTPVPFKVTFDDANGTVAVESGKYSMTAKAPHLWRGLMNMSCVGANVSFVMAPQS